MGANHAPGGGRAPGVAGSAGVSGTRRGACLLCRLPPLPLVYFPAPIPPSALAERSSRREGGDFRLFYARGFAPCIPAPEPARRWGMGANHALGGGCAPTRHWLDLPLCCLVGGARRFWSPAAPAFSFLSCPLFPLPPSPVGKGETISLFRRGLPPPAPRALNRLRHLQSLPSRYPEGRPRAALGNGGEPRAQRGVCLRRRQFGAKPTGSGSLRAEPAAKERGDRGRGTSAFEMVLSPGAGRASAARGKLLAGHHSGRDSRYRRGIKYGYPPTYYPYSA